MARGPDGKGGGAGFSLADQLFNAETLGQLAGEFAAGVPGFDAERYLAEVLPKLPDLELMARMEAMADGLEAQLAPDFPTMAEQVQAAMPAPLDPTRRDDDFGQFIHAMPGILAVRHGLEAHRDRALDLLYEATQRFSMEFYIRPFLNHWPRETLDRLSHWAGDDNYHVRRLVSEGTRPKLPWAKAITLDPLVPLTLLDRLHADETRFVTRSVSNHLNDISKIAPDAVLERLETWQRHGRQGAKEMKWMTRHALRSLIKQGHPGALAALGYRGDAPVNVTLTLAEPEIARGDPLRFDLQLTAGERVPVLVDYILWFRKADGALKPKVFKLKQTEVTPRAPVTLSKTHKLKWDATTFRLYPGLQRLGVQVNGRVIVEAEFTLLDG
ncbi:DNA alkylation repair protein [Primorskyibacter aestuariivivens]|uniref:DNA alkylation repair protein n=1 Tax=Primorskyibacter aestuariivivens TaxID=1888912 RepID=UPI002301CF34|nr:DNA alkylation repair protein [Primorskyibacter aestuariivivens]MDA7428758.1 DNA alkylation repair protein [Primorskyibacter aestuariivivens]